MRQIRQTVKGSQSGFAAIVVVFVLMIVIAITVIGFATIIRHAQQAALDRHLSSRAYYAAESGLNMATQALEANNNLSALTCNSAPGLNYVLDNTTQTEVSCLTINPSQPELLYTVSQDHGQVVPINTTADLGSLILSWQSTTATSSTNYSGCAPMTNFSDHATWPTLCPGPLLRVDLAPANGTFGRSTLDNGVATIFLYPHSNGNGMSVDSYATAIGVNQGILDTSIHCNAPSNNGSTYHCVATINGIPAGWQHAYMRFMTYYFDSLVSIKAQGTGGAPLQLVGAQATIDSTGRAEDVVRRVQARVPLVPETPIPDAAVESAAGICKLYEVVPGPAPVVTQQGSPAGFGPTACD